MELENGQGPETRKQGSKKAKESEGHSRSCCFVIFNEGCLDTNRHKEKIIKRSYVYRFLMTRGDHPQLIWDQAIL